MASGNPTVLFVANFPANTGFAWTHIEGLFARVADELHREGGRTLVAYPSIDESPATLEESRAIPVEADLSLRDLRSVWSAIELVRRERVKVLYLTDHRIRNWRYAVLRGAGVRRIVVHDRVSGAGTAPRGIKKLVKTLLHRLPLVTADHYVAVSDFVERRLVEVGRVPMSKVTRIYNGFPVADGSNRPSPPSLRKVLEIEDATPVIACACRASPEKGVSHLLRAFDRLVASGSLGCPPVLVYLGAGPHFDELKALRDELPSRDRIFMPGYLPDAVPRLSDADLFVVPSVWQDAFPSAVLEPMAWGKPVVASAVGGIPEMVEDGVTGLLVPPGDEERLCGAMEALLSNPGRARSFGAAAKRRVGTCFRPDDQVSEVAALVRRTAKPPSSSPSESSLR